jgi:hypothetical protein
LRGRLGTPERCTTEDPGLRTLAVGHEVACHFGEQVDGSIEQRQAIGLPTATAVGGPAVEATDPSFRAMAPAPSDGRHLGPSTTIPNLRGDST